MAPTNGKPRDRLRMLAIVLQMQSPVRDLRTARHSVSKFTVAEPRVGADVKNRHGPRARLKRFAARVVTSIAGILNAKMHNSTLDFNIRRTLRSRSRRLDASAPPPPPTRLR